MQTSMYVQTVSDSGTRRLGATYQDCGSYTCTSENVEEKPGCLDLLVRADWLPFGFRSETVEETPRSYVWTLPKPSRPFLNHHVLGKPALASLNFAAFSSRPNTNLHLDLELVSAEAQAL